MPGRVAVAGLAHQVPSTEAKSRRTRRQRLRAAIVAELKASGGNTDFETLVKVDANITFDLDVVTPIKASLNDKVDASEDQPQ